MAVTSTHQPGRKLTLTPLLAVPVGGRVSMCLSTPDYPQRRHDFAADFSHEPFGFQRILSDYSDEYDPMAFPCVPVHALALAFAGGGGWRCRRSAGRLKLVAP